MKKIAIVAAALVLVGATEARAQEWFWGGAYSTVLPLSNTKEFNDGFSWRGVMIEGRKVLNQNASVGVTFGWHIMNDKQSGTVEFEQGAIDGTAFTYTNAFPVMANAHYYLGQRGGPRPFLGANVGTNIIERRAEIGLFALTENNWHFAVAPEVGIVVPLGWYVRGMLSARWHYMTSAGSTPSQQYVSFNIGIASN
jgi:hypothetical protein